MFIPDPNTPAPIERPRPRDLGPLLSRGGPILQRVVRDAQRYRFQVLVGAPELSAPVTGPDGLEQPARERLAQSAFRADAEYFYPASTVKLCACLCALRRVEALQRDLDERVSADTPYVMAGLETGEEAFAHDPSNLAGGKPCVRHDVRLVGLVSDNPAFNRLYDFVGHQRLNEWLRWLGLPSAIINHRLSDPRGLSDHRATAAFTLELPDGTRHILPAKASEITPTGPDLPGMLVGSAHDIKGVRVDGPMDFSSKNRCSLHDLQSLLHMVVSPSANPLRDEPVLSGASRELLLLALSVYPGDSANPRFARERYPDHHAKFFLPGLLRLAPREHWRVTNKCGQAYGFSTDNAYIEHLPTGKGVYLAATVYTNDNGVVGDDAYEYEAEALPCLAQVAEVVAREFLLTPPKSQPKTASDAKAGQTPPPEVKPRKNARKAKGAKRGR